MVINDALQSAKLNSAAQLFTAWRITMHSPLTDSCNVQCADPRLRNATVLSSCIVPGIHFVVTGRYEYELSYSNIPK